MRKDFKNCPVLLNQKDEIEDKMQMILSGFEPYL